MIILYLLCNVPITTPEKNNTRQCTIAPFIVILFCRNQLTSLLFIIADSVFYTSLHIYLLPVP